LITLPGDREPGRWVLTEEEPVYRAAFGIQPATAERQQEAAETILARFLETHALVGLGDVLSRYPFEPDWARRKLQEWATSCRLVSVPPAADTETVQWSAQENLDQVRRGSLALLRREILTVSPQQFADFVLHWQRIHPDARKGEASGVDDALTRLQALPLPAELWERVLLPARVPGYQARWLDEMISGGTWTWAAQGDAPPGPGLLAFLNRGAIRSLARPLSAESSALTPFDEQILVCLQTRGASFVADLALDTRLSPEQVRSALWNLSRHSLGTNDRFDVIRQGEECADDLGGVTSPTSRRSSASRRRTNQRPEGRWSLLPWGNPSPEERIIRSAKILLHRYAVAARELALLDPWMPAWRLLYEVLSRMELSGEVRRGYFVEGLSGAQFALPEAMEPLRNLHLPSTANQPAILLHSLDPANLYGSAAPFDIPLLDGGTRSFVRRAGNWLVVRAGRPVLLIEGQGKRLTALASASAADKVAAVARLPVILDGDRSSASRHKLEVEEWNGQLVTATEGRELLEAAGFVRDYQGMVLYGAWR
jgi:ATP-dependent Lhr-like helicase